MNVKAGDVFVQDAGGGSLIYRIATSADTCIVLHVTVGGLYSLNTRQPFVLVDEWPAAKYGDPVPISNSEAAA